MLILLALAAQGADTAPVPQSDPASWFPASAYPADAPRDAGPVSASLAIDPMGRIIGCRIVKSSGISSVDRATCEWAHRNVRFAPARHAGQPVAGTYDLDAIRWTTAR